MGIARSRATMQTVGMVHPALNLKRGLLEKVSEDKRDGVRAGTSSNAQEVIRISIIAQSYSVCQDSFFLRRVANGEVRKVAPITFQ